MANEYLPLNPNTHDELIGRMRELGLLNDSTAAPSRWMGVPIAVSPFVPIGEVRFRDMPSFIGPEQPKIEVQPWVRWLPVSSRVAREVQEYNDQLDDDVANALANLLAPEED